MGTVRRTWPRLGAKWPTMVSSAALSSASRWSWIRPRRLRTSATDALPAAHGRLETKAVEAGHRDLGLLPGLGGDHRLALVVHLQHQSGRRLEVVTEEPPEDQDDVRHEGDRVIPDQHVPARVANRVLAACRGLDGRLCRGV